MPDTTDLSELQLSVMRVLWTRREASVAEVHAALSERGLAITTVATLLTRLEKRGAVTHRSEGRLFIYRAAITEPDVKRSMLGSLVESLFAGDPAAVVGQLLEARDLAPGDLDRMRALLNDDGKRREKRHE